jgi:hypothetical protein
MRSRGLRVVVEHADEVAGDATSIRAEIERTRAAGLEAHAEIDRLLAARAETFGEHAANTRRVEELRWHANRLAEMLPRLDQALHFAEARRVAEMLPGFRYRAEEIYKKLKTAILAAAEAQEEASLLREEAGRAVGEAAVQVHLPPVAFKGLLLAESVRLWAANADRIWSAPWSPPVPSAPQPPRPPLTRAEHEELKTRPHGLGREMATTGSKAPPPKVRTPPAAPAIAPQPRPLHTAGPPESGERRITFIRHGVPLNPEETDRSRVGDVVNVPDEMALHLLRNGAATEVLQ